MGCFAKGCLTVVIVLMILGVMIGGFGWFMVKNARAYFTQEPVSVRTFTATDQQYEAVLGKLQPFMQAATDGHSTSLTLSAEDLNVLIAKYPAVRPSETARLTSIS